MSQSLRDHVVHVVFAADANYAMPLAVAMVSTATNCDRRRALRFHVIQSGIGHELRTKIESSLKSTGFPDARIEWVEAPLDRLLDLKIADKYISPLTYARLLIPDLLPVEVEKAAYLDCDIVVNEDIGELWDTHLEQKSLFAVRDSIAFVSAPGGLVNYRELSIPGDAHYFNAGVLMMNLKNWRERDISEKVLRYLRIHRPIIRLNDQEALNAVLFDDWRELDYRWNWQIDWRRYRLGRAERLWVPTTTRKSIVHFTTAEKPWLPGCDYEEKRYFFEYLERTEWSGWRVSLLQEMSGRALRALREARSAVGRLRRKPFRANGVWNTES